MELNKIFVLVYLIISFSSSAKTLKVGFVDEIYLQDKKTPSWGHTALNGLKMSLQGKEIEIFTKDVGFSPIKAQSAAKDLVANQKVDVLVGLRIANQAILVSKIARENKIPYISIMATPDQLFKKDDYIFSMAFRNSYQVETLVKELNKNKHKEVISFVTQDCYYCVTMEEELGKRLKEIGGEVKRGATLLHRKPVDKNVLSDLDFKNKVIAIFTDEFEALSLIHLLVSKGFRGDIVGGDSWSVQSLKLEEKKDILKNICLINSLSYDRDEKSQNNQQFKLNYNNLYKDKPTDLSALGYDVGLVLEFARAKCINQKSLSDCIKKEIYAINLKGVTGQVSFENDGGRTKHNESIKRIGNCRK